MPLVLPGDEVSLNEPGRLFERHHHLKGYAALIVSGSCDEAGDRGRFRACAGDVLVHRSFEAHQDRIGMSGAKIINFRLDKAPYEPFGSLADPDLLARVHERDPIAASELFVLQFVPRAKDHSDWPDLLAEELSAAEPMGLEHWAVLHGLNPSSLSRGFRLAYGVTPKRFRFEQMVSRAARGAKETGEALSMLAASSGFADQAHMTRAMTQLFGVTPTQLRRMS